MRFPRNNTQIASALWLLLAVAGLALALAGARPPATGDVADEALAWVNERPITGAQLARAEQRLTFSGSAVTGDADRRALLQLLVDEELLLQRAEALGVLRQDPGVRKAIVRSTIDGIVQDFLANAPDRARLEQFYRERSAAFERPARLAVAALQFESAAVARQALASADGDWQILASHIAARPVRYLPASPLPAHMLRRYLGPGPAELALSLEAGDISEPVPGAGGVYLLTVTEKVPAFTPGFDVVAPVVREEYLARGRELALTETLVRLWRDADIRLDAAVETAYRGNYQERAGR